MGIQKEVKGPKKINFSCHKCLSTYVALDHQTSPDSTSHSNHWTSWYFHPTSVLNAKVPLLCSWSHSECFPGLPQLVFGNIFSFLLLFFFCINFSSILKILIKLVIYNNNDQFLEFRFWHYVFGQNVFVRWTIIVWDYWLSN